MTKPSAYFYFAGCRAFKDSITRIDAAKKIWEYRRIVKADPSWHSIYIDREDDYTLICLYEPYDNSSFILIE